MEMLGKAKDYLSEKMTVPMPEATLDTVHINSVSREGVEYKTEVAFTNPYVTPIPICEIHYCLMSNGREIASGKIPDPGSLKAKDTTMLTIPVKVQHNIMVCLIKDIGADWDIDYQLDVNFVIDIPVVGNINIPVSRKGEIKLPTLSDFF